MSRARAKRRRRIGYTTTTYAQCPEKRFEAIGISLEEIDGLLLFIQRYNT
jgi:hypothetical protein